MADSISTEHADIAYNLNGATYANRHLGRYGTCLCMCPKCTDDQHNCICPNCSGCGYDVKPTSSDPIAPPT